MLGNGAEDRGFESRFGKPATGKPSSTWVPFTNQGRIRNRMKKVGSVFDMLITSMIDEATIL